MLRKQCGQQKDNALCVQLQKSFKESLAGVAAQPETIFRTLRDYCSPSSKDPTCRFSYLLLARVMRIIHEKSEDGNADDDGDYE
jgi:hypothetical protein